MKPKAAERSGKNDPCPDPCPIREAVHREKDCPMHPCAARGSQVRQGR